MDPFLRILPGLWDLSIAELLRAIAAEETSSKADEANLQQARRPKGPKYPNIGYLVFLHGSLHKLGVFLWASLQ